MINILSIDLDWIMEPCIQLYNNLINEGEDDHLSIVNIGTVLNADLNKYAQISDLLFTKLNYLKINDITITDSHALLPQTIRQWNIKNNFIIYNIDHHHDCGYPDADEAIPQLLKEDNCGNWVPRVLKINNYFSKYIWIGNKNSDTNINENLKFYLPQYECYTDIDILNNITFNKLFICKSFAWIPLEYRPLLNSLITAFMQYIKRG